MTNNVLNTRSKMTVDGDTVEFYSLRALEDSGIGSVARLPYALKILLENLLRCEDGRAVTQEDIVTLADWDVRAGRQQEIAFTPARVLLQDFTGVPVVVDLAAMRDGVARLGGDPARVNPRQPVDLVIDHSVQVDHYGKPEAFQLNAELEFSRNRERYAFLRWGQNAFENFSVVPPDTGIVHQVNLEYLAHVVCLNKVEDVNVAYPDTLVGTDSHTTMVNGLGVVGWGVGGIEAEAAMLGQPISMLIPDVIGVHLFGRLAEGVTATDLVLAMTERLRQYGVVGKFVEFYGPGLAHLTLADRATLGNMSPEYGATVAVFPIDDLTLDYLRLTGRDPRNIRLVESYAKTQGLFREMKSEAVYSDTIDFDLAAVEPSLAGPRRPQDRVSLSRAKDEFYDVVSSMVTDSDHESDSGLTNSSKSPDNIDHGAVVVAAITSCTNTSNPSVMIGAGLLAKKAVERGLKVKPWVKTSFAPGSLVVTEYLAAAGLLDYLDQLGFHLVGYGCTTCIGNSGPLPKAVSTAIAERKLIVASVLSGNRNFEGRIQSQIRANYLASPPLVVAYALAGSMMVDLTSESLGQDAENCDVFLHDIWPSAAEIQDVSEVVLRTEMFKSSYAGVFEGDERWRQLPTLEGQQFNWDADSTYIRNPPFFDGLEMTPPPLQDIMEARVLALLGDSVTTDHISPAGAIPADSPAGKYLLTQGVRVEDFNSYGARRGNHNVMMRGTFGNIRLRNQLAPGTEGGWTRLQPKDELLSIYDAAMSYKSSDVPLLILAGKEYGSGSSRDWAAKGTRLLGVRAVLAESFERIHRSNLVNMGVLPLEFKSGESAQTYSLTGREKFDVEGIAEGLTPRGRVTINFTKPDGSTDSFKTTVRIDTPEEFESYKHGGILPYVLRQLVNG